MNCFRVFRRISIWSIVSMTCLTLLTNLSFSACSCGQESAQQESSEDTKEEQITIDGRLKTDPVFIDGGNSIVYSSLEKFNQMCLMKIDLSSKPYKAVRFHPSANTSELMVSFAKDEKQYAYLRNNGNLHIEIVLENKKKGTAKAYNPGGGFAAVRNVSCAPDGSNVLFAFPDQNGPQQIRVLQANGETVFPLTDSKGLNISPSYSSDGSKIAFASSREGDFDIFVMNGDGSAPTNVTQTKGLETHPAWSPDGKHIAFTRLHNGNYDVFLMRADGSNVRRFTRNAEMDDYACWSPDGNRLFG